jgi:long-chain acyl-CoA synthetase
MDIPASRNPGGAITALNTREGLALDAQTLCEAFQRTAGRYAEKVALRTSGDAVLITWAEYAERVERIAAGLAALGVSRGDTVGIMLVNRPEFNLIDTAALHLGATPFSVYNSSPAEQIAYLFGNAANRVIVTERGFLPVIQAAMAAGGEVEHVVLVDGEQGGTISVQRLEAMGEPGFDFEATWRAVRPGDLATLIYTSGTTGPPKGVQLTHANLLADASALLAVLDFPPADRVISWLPAAHIADRMLNYYLPVLRGLTITCCDDPKRIADVLQSVRPHWFFAVPRVWEKLKATLEAGGLRDPKALTIDSRAAVRAKLGLDQAKWLNSAGAPIPSDVVEYFAALGLPVSQLFGMSELSGAATLDPPGAIRIGTVGPPLPGVELRLADDGELLVRGPMVTQGYRGDPDRTREAIDEDGWLHTGDIAEIDDDGYVTIVDRKKELIINAAGQNMSPANIEAALKSAHPLIGQAVAIGDRRPCNTALIVLDPDVCAAFARDHGIEDSSPTALASDGRVCAAVAAAVADANTRLSRVEQIKRHTILPCDWGPGGDELTPTMKLRRKPINVKYATEIDAMYADTERTPA